MPNVLTPLQKFHLRCWARAQLWQIAELEFLDAIDELEVIRLALGLDADVAQVEIAHAFAAVTEAS